MKVTAKIKLDLRSQNYGSSVYAVQGDGGSRCVEAALLDGGKPWNVPAGVTAAVAYKKPDFTKGLYDKLADDTPAVTVSGSTVTVVLAKQMLTVPGSVQACIVFNNVALDQLTTFPFTVAVAANPAIGAEPSDDYIRLQWLEDKLDEYVKKITEGIVPGGSGGAVSSVNGKTGAVVLTADDVHALPDNTVIPTVPEKVSAFENDAGYLTEHQDISGKVDKVAGKGLSTHDYDDAAKAKVDAIPEDPKYTDTVYDDTAVVESLNQLKKDLSQLRNTGDNPAPAGKVWTSTDVGAGFAEPKKQPVPNKLTFIGAATGEFDGSNPLTINIPSGGGGGGSDVWELVADTTLTEPTAGFSITEWPDGTNLALKKYVAFVDGIPKGTYAGGIRFDAGTASSYNLFLRYINCPNSAQKYSFVEYEALGNRAYRTTSGTVDKNSLGYAGQNEVSTYNYDTSVADNFTVNRIGIDGYGGFEYPIGTKIKVYGVRA